MQKIPEVKVVVLGDTGVGKSSICLRFVSNKFQPESDATIGASFMSKTVAFEAAQKTVKFQIWDTAGQEKYRSLAPMYYRDCKIAIIVYDITIRSSFDCLKSWVEELKDLGPTNIVLGLAGNKCDLVEKEVVSDSEAKSLANDIGAIFCPTSAKDSLGIEKLFMDTYKKLDPDMKPKPKDTISLGPSTIKAAEDKKRSEKDKKCGC